MSEEDPKEAKTSDDKASKYRAAVPSNQGLTLEGWDPDDERAADPYRNAATLLSGGDDVSIASSGEITVANISLASGIAGAAKYQSGKSIYDDKSEVTKLTDFLEDETRRENATAWKKMAVRACLAAFALSVVLASLIVAYLMQDTNGFNRTETFTLDEIPQPVSTLPSNYRHISGVRDPPEYGDGSVPLLWDIPGDGDVLQHVISTCLGLVAAGGALGDKRQTHVASDAPLSVFNHSDGSRYVNVYTGTADGIERARKVKLIESGMADTVYAPLIYEAGSLFSDTHKGRMFAMFHHPVHRVYSVYHIVRTIVPEFSNKTIEEFLDTPQGANNNNWLTRELAGDINGEANEEHFQTAKKVIREKCLVGLTSNLDSSLQRVVKYFDWGAFEGKDDYLDCIEEFEMGHSLDRLYFDLVKENSHEWNITESRNYYDMRLHEFAIEVYKEQADMFVEGSAMSVSSAMWNSRMVPLSAFIAICVAFSVLFLQ